MGTKINKGTSRTIETGSDQRERKRGNECRQSWLREHISTGTIKIVRYEIRSNKKHGENEMLPSERKKKERDNGAGQKRCISSRVEERKIKARGGVKKKRNIN